MSDGTKRSSTFVVRGKARSITATDLDRIHPSWFVFIHYCGQLQHGEIERLKIQDGLPILAEVIKEKIKFTS